MDQVEIAIFNVVQIPAQHQHARVRGKRQRAIGPAIAAAGVEVSGGLHAHGLMGSDVD
jgi:hypothetical protein